ncbi:hypothetical protein LIER_34987 [Lithospermum erythrorhizon]|uniref:Integrase catalytic domain-containing protein n=1 Tax=Lithospermum erythrorhizon TaxID=34254 RepID=A0AAV3NI23_LITER
MRSMPEARQHSPIVSHNDDAYSQPYSLRYVGNRPSGKTTKGKRVGGVLTRFGIPRILVSDNGAQFASSEFQIFCEKYGRIGICSYKYKHLMARSYYRSVKGRQFRMGDLVLKLYAVSHPNDVHKLSPKWEEPYRVCHVLGPGTYELE